jgi:Uma2 family endonuclease
MMSLQMRKPNIAYLSKTQILEADNGEDPIPEFTIEIISGNDQINLVEEKIIEYYKASVKVV